jgi:hypothetical protein
MLLVRLCLGHEIPRVPRKESPAEIRALRGLTCASPRVRTTDHAETRSCGDQLLGAGRRDHAEGRAPEDTIRAT